MNEKIIDSNNKLQYMMLFTMIFEMLCIVDNMIHIKGDFFIITGLIFIIIEVILFILICTKKRAGINSSIIISVISILLSIFLVNSPLFKIIKILLAILVLFYAFNVKKLLKNNNLVAIPNNNKSDYNKNIRINIMILLILQILNLPIVYFFAVIYGGLRLEPTKLGYLDIIICIILIIFLAVMVILAKISDKSKIRKYGIITIGIYICLIIYDLSIGGMWAYLKLPGIVLNGIFIVSIIINLINLMSEDNNSANNNTNDPIIEAEKINVPTDTRSKEQIEFDEYNNRNKKQL